MRKGCEKKPRFEVFTHRVTGAIRWIRAFQGHSGRAIDHDDEANVVYVTVDHARDMRLFHGTNGNNVDSIFRTGLVPGFKREGDTRETRHEVYFTTSYKQWATNAYNQTCQNWVHKRPKPAGFQLPVPSKQAVVHRSRCVANGARRHSALPDTEPCNFDARTHSTAVHSRRSQ